MSHATSLYNLANFGTLGLWFYGPPTYGLLAI